SIGLAQGNIVWQTIGRMLIPVAGGQAIVKDSLVYILGGYSDSLKGVTNIIQEFNPRTNKWRIVGGLQLKRYGFFAGINSDSVLIIGGISGPTAIRNGLEVWKVNKPSYIHNTVNPNFNRMFPTGAVLNNKLYLAGGSEVTSPHDTSNVHYLVEYDIPTSSITFTYDSLFNLRNMPSQQMSAFVNNSLYIFGGIYFGISQSIYSFNISTKQFQKLVQRLPKGRAGGGAVYAGNDKIFLIGGFDENQSALNSVDIFSLQAGNIGFQQGPRLNFPRRELMAVRFGNSIYVFGGRSQFGQTVEQVERLDLITDVADPFINVKRHFRLFDNYPNPFNPITSISFEIEQKNEYSLDVFSLMGEHKINLFKGILEPGFKNYVWNGEDKFGYSLPSGIYLYRLQSNSHSETKKMMLIK
ncbi:MAG: T9SS type A sorting domain-containing protein, partial [Ignavibacteria bacterium]|nr:T9SS type A sorting domain-containing protein [Ignavibacteria bacterium]